MYIYIYIYEICDFPLPRLITKGYQEWEHPEARQISGTIWGHSSKHGPADNFHMSIVHIMDAKNIVQSFSIQCSNGSVSKPCTPVVHIKIAGIYGCSSP